jgi:predicted amidohydrolase
MVSVQMAPFVMPCVVFIVTGPIALKLAQIRRLPLSVLHINLPEALAKEMEHRLGRGMCHTVALFA